jgi:hypothetical protein
MYVVNISALKKLFFQMSLWCDKYRPKKFDELDYQLEQAELLKTIVKRIFFIEIFAIYL